MSAWLFPGLMGLLTGLVLHWTELDRPRALRCALGLRRSYALRSGLTALGWGMALTAFLCWLAVIDVDTITVLPLSLGALVGGVLLGAAAGGCGFLPSTAFAGLAVAPLEALCVLAGCAAMTWLLPLVEDWFLPLQHAAPYADATLFQVTLDEPFLLGGGFLGQGCAGLLLAAIALCIPSPQPLLIADEEVIRRAAETPLPTPEDAPEDTFVATLPGEEPLVVDTALDEAATPDDAPAENEPSAENAKERTAKKPSTEKSDVDRNE